MLERLRGVINRLLSVVKRSFIHNKGIVLITHRNVDIDSLVSCYLLQHFYKVTKIITNPDTVHDADVIVVDMPITKDLVELFSRNNLRIIAHYDHHYEGCPYSCTAEVIRDRFKSSWEPWMDYFVDLARVCDTAEIFKYPNPIKYFHISGLLAALRRKGYSDKELIDFFFSIFDAYANYFRRLVKAREKIRKVPIYEVGEYRVAILRENSEMSIALDELGIHLVIYDGKMGIGVTRNSNCTNLDLRKLKPAIEAKLREKGRPDEIDEWFFHPKGFIACRGSRKHPVSTPSVLSAKDILEAIKVTFG